jgi:glycosyltransferase involved in cell wall biosynthesis
MSKIKRPDLLIAALNILNKKNINFTCDFYGDPMPENQNYQNISFHHAVPNYEAPKIYQSHEIFVNLTPTGSFDKTILEAAACGCIPIVTNQSLAGEIDDNLITTDSSQDIAEKINFWLNVDDKQKEETSQKLKKYVLENHSLESLVNELTGLITS